MSLGKPAFTLGVEEEYLLVDPETRDLASRPPKAFMQRCEEALGPHVTHEFLQSQVEIGTSVCQSVGEVRDELVAAGFVPHEPHPGWWSCRRAE